MQFVAYGCLHRRGVILTNFKRLIMIFRKNDVLLLSERLKINFLIRKNIMDSTMKPYILILFILTSLVTFSQEKVDSLQVFFRQGKSDIDLAFSENGSALSLMHKNCN